MNAFVPPPLPLWSAALAAVASLALFRLERRGRAGIAPAAAVLVLAAVASLALAPLPALAPLVVGVAIAALARDPDEILHSECALKLLWALGSACVLSWAGQELLVLATGTAVVREQWAVLGLGLEPTFLWSTALPLALLAGVVLLGCFPFHFWVADLFQGARPWLAPLVVAALQVSGALWLSSRLAGIEAFPQGARLARSVLSDAVVLAFAAGGATLLVQRRPERRAGTLAGLQGGLMLAMLTVTHGDPGFLARWAAHLAIALTGASTLSRFLPVSSEAAAPGAPLFRRHPWIAVIGCLPLLSLAGVPGLPGALLWLDAARALVRHGHTWGAVALAGAWILALAASFRQVREAFGVAEAARPPQPAPAVARIALVAAGAGVLALGWTWWLAR